MLANNYTRLNESSFMPNLEQLQTNWLERFQSQAQRHRSTEQQSKKHISRLTAQV